MSSKKVGAFLFSFILLSTAGVVIHNIPEVKAGSVNSVETKAGAINCIVNFTLSDSSDDIIIYYSKSSGVDTSDNESYSDPGFTNRDYTSDRQMLLRGLEDSTTYYFKLYAEGEGWCDDVEYNFTTLPRFTTEYKDEFFDEYLIESSNDIKLEQQSGVKETVDNPIEEVKWVSWISIIEEDNLYRMYCGDMDDMSTYITYTSSDGITDWSHEGNHSFSPSLTNRNWGVFVKADGVYVHVTKEAARHASTYKSDTATGTQIEQEDGSFIGADVSPANEADITSILEDTLGANWLYITGQNFIGSGTNIRECGDFYILNKYDYDSNLYWDQTYLPCFEDESCSEGRSRRTYAYQTMIKSGVYIAAQLYYDDIDGSNDNTGYLYPFLSVSRNGSGQAGSWHLVNSSMRLIELGDDGAFDDGMIMCATPPLINIGDYDYMYYRASDAQHQEPRNEALGRKQYRKDGLTAMIPESADAYIHTTAIPSQFVANFTVNFNGTATAGLNIAVLDADDNFVYSGFSFSDFDTITTNSTSHSPSWGSRTLSNIPDGDFKLNFSWTGVGSGELYSYSIDSGNRSDTLSFQSINNQANNTVTYDIITDFNWTKTEGASYYQLQIANDSGFTDVFVNLTDINIYNYPANYVETTDSVEFTLPEAYRKTWYGEYYFRVRAFTK
jgi:hypothetical protein